KAAKPGRQVILEPGARDEVGKREGSWGQPDIEVILKLIQDHIGPDVLAKSQPLVLSLHGFEDVLTREVTPHQARLIDSAMRPWVASGQQGGGARHSKVAGRVMRMINCGPLCKTDEIGCGGARVVVDGQIPGAHRVEQNDDDVGWEVPR